MNRFVVLIALVIFAAAAWSAGWVYVAGRVEAEIAALENADGYSQPRLVCGELSVGGYPFQFHPSCVDATVTTGDIDIAVAQIDATALFYRPTHIQFFAVGPARVSDLFYGTTQEVSWQELRGSARIDNDRIGRISLVASEVAYADALMTTTVLATASHLELHLIEAPSAETPSAGDALDLYLTASNANLPAFELASADLVVDGRLTGLPPLSALAAMTTPDALARWQDNGGAFTLRNLDASADGLAVAATGEVSLDPQGRLNGEVELTSQGVVDRLAGIVGPALAQVVLGEADAEGRSSQSVTFNAGTVQVGIIPVQTLPPLF